MCFSLKLIQMWIGFEIFHIWDIISSYVFSNHCWWFEIPKHTQVCSCKFCTSFVCAHCYASFMICFELKFLRIWQVNIYFDLEMKGHSRWFMLLGLHVCEDSDNCNWQYGSTQQFPLIWWKINICNFPPYKWKT